LASFLSAFSALSAVISLIEFFFRPAIFFKVTKFGQIFMFVIFYSFSSFLPGIWLHISNLLAKSRRSSIKDGSFFTSFQLPLNPINYLLFPDRLGTEKTI